MSKGLKGLEIEKNLLQLGLYFVDLKNALNPLLTMDSTNITSEIDRLKKQDNSWFSRKLGTSKGVPTVKTVQTLNILDTSLIDFALNISEFNKELKQLKDALEKLNETL
jgi:hypothetical protein